MDLQKLLKAFALSSFLALSAQPLAAQDLLARQAPVDRKAKALDTLELRSLINREVEHNVAQTLYTDFSNAYAHKATPLPDSLVINLRHFCMPTPSRVITSNFGSRWGGQHKGLDIKVYIGDTIRAAWSGKVRVVRYEARGYGNYVVIRHPNGLETIYGHLSKQLVEENQEVRAGEPIGLGGNTGRSTGSHLHFETRLCGVALNPALFFDFRAQDITADTYTFRSDTYKSEGAEATRLRGKVGNGSYTPEMVRGHAAPEEPMAMAPEGKSFHVVAKGETLSSIAAKRGVSIEQICRLNRLSKNSKLRPGQMLRYS